MQSVLLIVQLIVAVALIIVILLQRSEGGALGIGGSGSGLGGMFSARGAADTLTRTTAFLAAAFFIISIVLNILTMHSHENRSILDTTTAPSGVAVGQTAPIRHPAGPQPTPPKAPAPQVPTVPPSH